VRSGDDAPFGPDEIHIVSAVTSYRLTCAYLMGREWRQGFALWSGLGCGLDSVTLCR
jgi:hypothetical protein